MTLRISLLLLLSVLCVHSYKTGQYRYRHKYRQGLGPGNNSVKPGRDKDKVDRLGAVLKRHVQALRHADHREVELIFLIDSSTTVGLQNFHNEIKFVEKLLADFTVDRRSARVGVVTFSSPHRVVRWVDHLTQPADDNHKCSLLQEDLPIITYLGGGTFTYLAVKQAQEMLKSARPDAKKAVFLITDGYSNSADPVPLAQELQRQGVEIFTFGIQNGNVKELEAMASEPKDEHRYILDSFEEFEALARRALHEDLHAGTYIRQDMSRCDRLCTAEEECCDARASCRCGTHTGTYECICNEGYYGTGLRDGCQACPVGTYKNFSGPGDVTTCIRCPDVNHVTPPGAVSVNQCTCRKGFRAKGNLHCAALTCPPLSPPEHGYFVQHKCDNVFHAACGIGCHPGYILRGSSLRLCKPNATWSGSPTQCVVKKCPELPRLENGYQNCTHSDFSFEATCYFFCNPGYKIVGSRMRMCLAIADWSGLAAMCRETKCRPLQELIDGQVEPPSCTEEDQPFGSTCQLSCRKGYSMVGPFSKQCTSIGRWTPDEDTDNRCIDVAPPVINCPDSIHTNAALGENEAEVTWNEPVAVDNSGVRPTVTVVPALSPPVRLPIGVTTITYFAEDATRNKAKCAFTVTVQDREPPRIDRCVSPPPFILRDEPKHVTWEEPMFSDNSGEELLIKQSHRHGFFKAGTTTVTYTAHDKYGNNNTCVLTIVVKEHACANPPRPVNGNITCLPSPKGLYCVLSCNEGFAFAISPATKYFCDYETGGWLPEDRIPFPDCSKSTMSNHVTQFTKLTFRADVSCDDRLLILNQVETNFRKKLHLKLAEYCAGDVMCSVTHLQTLCLDPDNVEIDNNIDTDLDNTLSNHIPVWGDANQLITFQQQRMRPPRSHSEGPKKIRVGFRLEGSMDSVSKEAVVSAAWQEALLSHVKDVMARLDADARDGVFDMLMSDHDIEFESLAFELAEPRFTCRPGNVLRNGSCVRCPVGTHFNVVSEECVGCPRGTYQPTEGKLTCLVCPSNTSTTGNQSKSINQCKGQCLPGSFSANGLEMCQTCAQGFYQPEYAQVTCVPCPDNSTTWRRGARTQDSCGVLCPRGYVSKTGLEPCFPCPQGYFQPAPGMSSCFICPGNVRTPRAGATNITECEGNPWPPVITSVTEDMRNEYNSIPTSELVVNECFREPCQNEAYCGVLAVGYTCNCTSGWTGTYCELEVDECLSAPCHNNATCTDQLDAFNCSCTPGFTGLTCAVDIDECESSPCENNGTCVDMVNGFHCECGVGFHGSYCEKNIDDCQPNPCDNNSTCVDGVASYTCSCMPGFEGKTCAINTDECLSTPCLNNATCVDEVNAFRCECVRGYAGVWCEQEVDECASSPCHGGATCLDQLGSFSCVCPPAYSGNLCQTKLNSSFYLHFESATVTNYVALEGMGNMTEITLAFWMRTNDTSHYGTPLSYATQSQSNAFTVMDYNGFVIYVNGEKTITDVTANDGKWHHICVTWTSHFGIWQIYKNGELKDQGRGLSPGTAIEGGGVLVLGQEQDSRGGDFSITEAFVGWLSKLHLWSHVLSTDDIRDLTASCDPYDGSVKAWPDFLSSIQGRIQRSESEFCQACPPLSSLQWGQVEVNASVARYECQTGFILVGPAVRRCKISAEWDSVNPSCKIVSCRFPGSVLHGRIRRVPGRAITYTYGSTVSYSCQTGYHMTGNDSVTCAADGRWNGPLPTCAEVTCEMNEATLPLRIKGGLGSRYRVNSLIGFYCSSGFKLHGEDTLRCQGNGTWNHSIPECREIACGPLPEVPNGLTKHGVKETYKVNTIVTYHCEVGHHIKGKDRIRCQENGSWTLPSPVCSLVKCVLPEIPEHAQLANPADSYTYGTNISYKCALGYQLQGPETLQCLRTQLWSSDAPLCQPVDCGTPRSIPNGYSAGLSTIFNSSLTYSCATGHDLVGNKVRKCQPDGTWSGEDPSCILQVCDPPEEVTNSIKTGENFSYGSTITYKCLQGYNLVGVPKRTCGPGGRWDNHAPVCDPVECPKPQTLVNGQTIGTSFSFDSVLQYLCDKGYELIGHSKRTCLWNATWSGDQPMCRKIKCPEPDVIQHGSYEVESYDPDSVVTYRCMVGYEVEGKHTRTCRIDGTWSGPVPECKSIHCSKPKDIKNGQVDVQDTKYGSAVKYSCQKGFQLDGPIERSCSDKKTWTGSEPQCDVITCLPPDPITHGSLEGEDFSAGSKVTYKCDDGYVLQGESQRECLETKLWAGQSPWCKAKECDKPSDVISNGRMISSNFSFGATIHYVCDPGYYIDGHTERTCEADGSWVNPIPVCERVECPKPSRISNCNIDGFDFRYKEHVTYNCQDGFQLTGPIKRYCQEDKTWSGEEPRCVKIDCGRPADILNGRFLLQGTFYQNSATVRCDPGYTLDGPEKLTCNKIGSWEGGEPVCRAVLCGLPPPISDGEAGEDQTEFGEQPVYKCKPGYILQQPTDAHAQMSCGATGNYTGQKPTCVQISCGSPTEIPNGQTLIDDNSYGGVARYVCRPGYELIGEEYVSCGQDGEWKGDLPACEVIICKAPAPVEHGKIDTSAGFNYGSKMYYSCEAGYALEGLEVRSCVVGSRWSGPEPKCVEVACLKPGVKYGYIAEATGPGIVDKHVDELDRFVFGMTITVECEDGYELQGEVTVACLADRAWSPAIPDCVPVRCAELIIPHAIFEGNSLFEHGKRLIITCEDGYELIGESLHDCQRDRKWSKEIPYCQLVTCPAPSFKNGNITVVRSPNFGVGYPFGITLKFQCYVGHIMKGDDVIECQGNKKWSSDVPRCDIVTCSKPVIDSRHLVVIDGNSATTYDYGKKIQFKCSDGFKLEGSSEMACQLDGTWSASVPSCLTMECDPPVIPHAVISTAISIHATRFVTGVTAKFKCEAGWQLKGSTELVCQSDATWSGEFPSCSRETCEPPLIEFGQAIPAFKTRDVYEYGVTVTFTCNDGFQLTAQGSTELTCEADGSWSGAFPLCHKVKCAEIKLENGVVKNLNLESDSGTFSFGDTISFDCDSGYTLVGASELICRADRTWSGRSPRCEVVQCPAPDFPNGVILGETRQHRPHYQFGLTVTFECEEGYHPVDGEGEKYTSTCQANQTWTDPVPTCELVSCRSLNISDAELTGLTTYGSTLNIHCDMGFTLIGDSTLKCLSSGKWVGKIPVCLPFECPEPRVPHAELISIEKRFPNIFTFGDVVLFQCEEGFELFGSAENMCLADETWAEEYPECRKVQCPAIHPIKHALMTVTLEDPDDKNNSYGTVVNAKCDLGFELVGDDAFACSPEGEWSGQMPKCHMTFCPIPYLKHGSFDGLGSGPNGEYLFGDSGRFRCLPGFELRGHSEMVCQPDKTWSDLFPTCHRLECIEPAVELGTVIGSSFLFEDLISFTCSNGYQPIGSNTCRCEADQTWNCSLVCERIFCPVPVEPANGKLIGLEFRYEDTIRYVCDDGFELQGDEFRDCLASAVWSGERGICRRILCPNPPVPDHGYFVGASYLFEDRIEYKCDLGYELQGERYALCQWDATWSSTAVKCLRVSCGAPQPVPNAIIKGASFMFGDNIEYVCMEGYEITGVGQQECKADKSWSGTLPSCGKIQCPVPAPLDSGKVAVTEYTFLSYVNYQCDAGFRLEGPEQRQCLAAGSWSGEDPSCIRLSCPSPPKIANGQVIGFDYQYESIVEYRCIVGFELKGSASRKCLANQEWSEEVPTCVAVLCPALGDIVHGARVGNNFTYTAYVEFNCIDGYQLKGVSRINCQADRTWSAAAPSCVKVSCPTPEPLLNGKIDGIDYSFESEIIYSCATGYNLQGLTRRRCMSNRKWSGAAALCILVECPQPEALENGQVDVTDMTFGSQLSYVCDRGFELEGRTTRSCQADATWSGKAAFCRKISCPSPPKLDNGYYEGDDYTFGSKIVYQCNADYYMQGTGERVCRSDKAWSGLKPTCLPKKCPNPPEVPHRKVLGTSLVAGSRITFLCDPGYHLVGQAILTCKGGEAWSGDFPQCDKVSCGLPKPIEKGMADGNSYEFEDIISYRCFKGYEIEGDAEVKCLANEKWSTLTAICVPISCGPPPDLEHAKAIGKEFRFGSYIVYSCETGYEIVGPDRLQCSEDGSWAGSQPRCSMVSCGPPPVIHRASNIVRRTTYGAHIRYVCNRGYILEGSEEAVCMANATWMFEEQPRCVPVDCGPPPALPSGGVRAQDFTLGNLARYTCDQGHYMTGIHILQCGADGKWNGTEPKCVRVSCPQPEAPSDGQVNGVDFTFGGIITFSCDVGFELAGQTTRTCDSDGSWSGVMPSCQPVFCQRPLVPDHGSLSSSDVIFRFDTTVMFYCDDGYEMVGVNFSRCTAFKEWTGVPPICLAIAGKPCPLPELPVNTQPVEGSFVVGDTVVLTCQEGHVTSDSLAITCQEDLKWTEPAGQCSRVYCGYPRSDMSVVHVRGRSFFYRDRVVFMCRPGRRPVGSQVITCLANGTWDHQPQCKATCKFGCRNGGKCIAPNKCQCKPGFAGRFCTKANCVLHCMHGGQCVAPFRCSCPQGYTGARCQTVVCDQPCDNGGRCVMPNRCQCPHGFRPPFCQVKYVRG